MAEERLATCPGCTRTFWARHGNRVYCSTECYDNHYNKSFRDNNRRNLQALRNNISFLTNKIGNKSEVVLPYDEFNETVFDFGVYSDRIPADPGNFLYYLYYGEYRTNLTTDGSIKIKLI